MKKRSWDIFVVPGSHFDYGWCAGISECLAYSDQIIKKAVDAISGKHPNFRFTIEYAMFLRHFLESYPEYYKIVKDIIKRGKLEVCSTMVGAMEQVLDGEVLIREITHAKHWIKDTFGIDVVTCQHSDLPGHTLQIAQILSKSGIKYLAYSRYRPPHLLHYWKSPDGSKIIACNHPFGYGWGLMLRKGLNFTSKRLPEDLKELEKLWPHKQVLMVEESDLLMPVPEICNTMDRWNRGHKNIKLKISCLTDFFKFIKNKALPIYQGEAPYGFYSLPACEPVTYKEARIAENRLASAEKFASYQEILGLGEYPYRRLKDAWEKLFNCHDHNAGGRHGRINDEVRTGEAHNAKIIAEEFLRRSMMTITTHIKYKKDNSWVPVVVFNPLSWMRSDVFATNLEFPGNNIDEIIVKDSDNKVCSHQVISRENAEKGKVDYKGPKLSSIEFAFSAKDIPPMGYKVFYVRHRKQVRKFSASKIEKNANNLRIENDFYILNIKDGWVDGIYAKKINKELVGKVKHKFNEIVVLEDLRMDLEDNSGNMFLEQREVGENFTGREWYASSHKSSFEIIEKGAIKTRIRFQGKVLNSPITQEITLYKDFDKIDLTTSIDWQGRKNTQIRIAYPFNIPGGEVKYEVPFGMVRFGKDEMPNTYRGTGGRFVQKWIDISNSEYGITLATRNCSHAFKGTTVYPIILRTTYSCGTPFYWYYNKGIQTFSYSIRAHKGGFEESHAYRDGWEFNNSLMECVMNTARPIAPIKESAFLPERLGLLSIDKPNVVVTTIKKSEKGEGWEIRLFEAEGKEGKISLTLTLPIRKAWETNLIGKKIKLLKNSDKKIDLDVSKYGIHTIRFIAK